MSMTRGQRFGPYEIGESIGVGGMGEVYRATDARLKRDVAIKVLPETFASDAQRVARFAREAEVLASLNHSNIAHLYGLEQSGNTTALVMELVDGTSLAERLAHGPLLPEEALEVALQIAAALEAAHARGIVHRDLKPANVKLRPDGTIKVLDFGVAKALDSHGNTAAANALTTPAMTEAGLVLGTAAYMAPEQARGKPVDARADIWAFGCVLYEMLTGKNAFLGDDVTSTLARVLEREPDFAALPKGIAPNLRTAIELCLRKDPRKRIADIRDVRLVLEGGMGQAAAPTLNVAREQTWRRAVPAAAVLGTLVLAGLYLVRPPADESTTAAAVAPVTRFQVHAPEGTQFANQGGYDVIISPDGERLAFFAEDGTGRMSVYIRDIDSIEARRLEGLELSTSLDIGNPTFSPSGDWIAVYSPVAGLIRVPLDGGPTQKIADVISGVFLGSSWGTDDTLVFSAGFQLFRVAATGGTPQPLTPTPEPNATRVFAAPVLLPRQRGVLFGSVDGDIETVVALDLVTGEQKVLVEGGQNPNYLPSGHLVFARGTTLMAAPLDIAELVLTGPPVALPEDVRDPSLSTAADYLVSASGSLVYFPNDAQDAREALVWVDRSGRNIGRAVPDNLVSPREPRLSPDGSRLTATTNRAADRDVWVYDLRGRPPVPLAVPDDNRSGVWSPDGTRVALSGMRGVAMDVFLAPADGSLRAPQRLRAERLSAWARDWHDNELVVVRFPQNDILGVDVTTGAMRDIVVTADNEIDPDVSPDGRWLAYASNRTGRLEIWVKPFLDGVPTRVSGNGGYEPRWSADGRELFYVQDNALMAVSIEAGAEFAFRAPTELFSTTNALFPDSTESSYDAAPDGRFLMIERQPVVATREPGFVVVQNWMRELEQRVPGNR